MLEMWRGTSCYIPFNFLVALAGLNINSGVSYTSFLATQLFFQTLAYPILTIQRRLMCQSNYRAGMIPMRYASPVHALGLTFREEGLRGLYRGYVPFFIASAIFWGIVPLAAEFSMVSNPMLGNFEPDRQGELLDEVRELKRQEAKEKAKARYA